MSARGTIQRALPMVARTVGRRLDVSVGIGGHDAYTDGKHIQLPALPLEAPDDELATLAFGYLEHEAAHVRYTDMESFKPESALHKMFTNIFEDVRIEKALGEEYPGFVEDLRGLTELLVRDGEMGGPQDPDAPLAAKMGEYALLRCRHEVLGPDALEEPAARAEKAFRDAVPPGLATRLGAALAQVAHLDSTEAASNLAKTVIRYVEEEAEEQQQAAQQAAQQAQAGAGNGQGQQAGGGESGDTGDGGIESESGGQGEDGGDTDQDNEADGQDQGGGDTDQDEGNGGQGQDGGDTDQGDEAGSQGQGGGDTDQGDEAGGQSQDGGDTDQDDGGEAVAMAEALKQALDGGDDGPKGLGEAAAEALKEAAQQQPHYGEGSGAGVGKAAGPIQVTSNGRTEIDKVSGATLALRTRLRGLLASAKRTGRRVARRGKRLDRKRLVRAMAGETKIFVNRTKGVAVNTAVQILVDRSGSMQGREMVLARESALACGLALAEIQGVNLATAAFPGGPNGETAVVPITRFGESVRRTAGRYAAIDAAGGTPLLEALLWGVENLLVQTEPRRLCLVVTDGCPNDSAACAEAIRFCWAGGIEVMGIGIGSRTARMENLFPVWTQVDSVDELALAMFTMMREALTRKPS